MSQPQFQMRFGVSRKTLIPHAKQAKLGVAALHLPGSRRAPGKCLKLASKPHVDDSGRVFCLCRWCPRWEMLEVLLGKVFRCHLSSRLDGCRASEVGSLAEKRPRTGAATVMRHCRDLSDICRIFRLVTPKYRLFLRKSRRNPAEILIEFMKS